MIAHHLLSGIRCMDGIVFDWDEQKAWSNERNHDVSFEEAQTAFDDEHSRIFHDPDHSQDEDRFVLLGMSVRWHLLMVCHVYRQNDKCIRIISARRVTKQERQEYRGFL
jgi:uncharacterized protein